jgi:integrase/recombinase XerD
MARYQPPAAVAEVLADWAADQQTQSLQPRSIEERTQAIVRYVRFSGETDPLAFSPRGIKRWIGRENLSPASKWTYGQHMRAYHAWLVKTKQRDDNPMDEVTIPKKPQSSPRPLEPHQLAEILKVVDAAHGPTRLMVLLAAFAGLRVHEIAKIHGKDFDPIAGTLRVEGKGRKKVTIPLHPAILAEASTYPRRELWFPGRHQKDAPPAPMTRHHVSLLIREAMEQAHVDATAHALRHTFATSLVNEDVDMLTIQKLMRHSSPTSTAIYAEVSRIRRAEAVNRLQMPSVDA